MFEMAAYRALCIGSDRDARDFASRGIPLTRELGDRYQWMNLEWQAGLAALFTGDVEGARDAFHDELAVCRDLVVLPAAGLGLIGLAAVAAARDEPGRAARLAGAAATHRYGEPEDAVGGRLQATFLDPVRARLGAEARDSAVRDGATLTFDDAIAYALSDSRTPAHTG
jgi:hypothetical protein